MTALLVTAPAKAAVVDAFGSGPFDPDPSTDVFYIAGEGEVNNPTFALSGEDLVITDPSATMTAGDPKCTASADGHTVACSPAANDKPIDSINAYLSDESDVALNSAAVATDGGVITFNGYGAAGNDAITGSNGIDLLRGGTGDDRLAARGGDDFLSDQDFTETDSENPDEIGSGGTNVFNGGAGDDELRGGPAQDTLRGGAGDDAFREVLASGQDRILAQGGIDLLSFQRVSGATEDADSELAVDVNLAQGAASTIGGSGETDEISGVEDVLGSAGSDVIVGTGAINDLLGLEGSDTVVGGGSPDHLYGNEGDDDLRSKGDGQADRVRCGADPDDRATHDRFDQVSGC